MYAPRGEMSALQVPLNHKHLLVISGIAPVGKLCMCVFEDSINGTKVVGFLGSVLREVSGRLAVVEMGS